MNKTNTHSAFLATLCVLTAINAAEQPQKELSGQEAKDMANQIISSFEFDQIKDNPSDPKLQLKALLLQKMILCTYKDDIAKEIPTTSDIVEKCGKKLLTAFGALRYLSSTNQFDSQEKKDIVCSVHASLIKYTMGLTPLVDPSNNAFVKSMFGYYAKYIDMKPKDIIDDPDIKKLDKIKFNDYSKDMKPIEVLDIFTVLVIGDEYLQSYKKGWSDITLGITTLVSLAIGVSGGYLYRTHKKLNVTQSNQEEEGAHTTTEENRSL